MDNQRLLEIIKELLELLVGELSVLNKRIENIEEEQRQMRAILELLLNGKEEKFSKAQSLAGKLSSVVFRNRTETFRMKDYVSFLMENPEKIPLQGVFKKPTPRKE
ncbi:MAG: hypothetical protein H5T91_10190 [Synergistetes bacterium]|nr:hypothetical protein [Synergistota bacterium]MDK2871873.1 hypothetical protein [bacterium]